MIPLNNLIRIYLHKINHLPISGPPFQDEIDSSTLAYLNAYRQTKAMLKDLAKDVQDIEVGVH